MTKPVRSAAPPAGRATPCAEICTSSRGVDPDILEQVIYLAVEIAREGREGRRLGTLFTVGDAPGVLARSRCLILDPLAGHPEDVLRLEDHNLRETLKELAQLDGAFVICDAGVARSACRYLDAPSRGIELPLGFGSRHMAAAAMSLATGCVAVAVSQSSVVRVFDDGELVGEILPELWLLSRHSIHLQQPYHEHHDKDIAVFTRKTDA